MSNSAEQIFVIHGANQSETAVNLAATINNSSSLHGLDISASADSTVVGITSSLIGARGRTLAGSDQGYEPSHGSNSSGYSGSILDITHTATAITSNQLFV